MTQFATSAITRGLHYDARGRSAIDSTPAATCDYALRDPPNREPARPAPPAPALAASGTFHGAKTSLTTSAVRRIAPDCQPEKCSESRENTSMCANHEKFFHLFTGIDKYVAMFYTVSNAVLDGRERTNQTTGRKRGKNEH